MYSYDIYIYICICITVIYIYICIHIIYYIYISVYVFIYTANGCVWGIETYHIETNLQLTAPPCRSCYFMRKTQTRTAYPMTGPKTASGYSSGSSLQHTVTQKDPKLSGQNDQKPLLPWGLNKIGSR
jgi:hypothetical protein